MEISCIVPVKNGEKLLEICLESLLKQTFSKNFEVCIFNDGSTDNTEYIISRYSEIFKSRKIGFKRGASEISGGVGFAKNQAIKLSKGKFLCFSDADDKSLPDRLEKQYNLCKLQKESHNCIVGSNFERIPKDSTIRYTHWANELTNKQLYTQIYTSFGPTLIAPTWFFSYDLYNKVGQFSQETTTGFPEDLDFFYRALRLGAKLLKLKECTVIYNYHVNCATLYVNEETIWKMRIQEIEKNLIDSWKTLTIWNAGKQGKKFYKSLSDKNKLKVIAMCDVDQRKINLGKYEIYDEIQHKIITRIPIISYKDAIPPVILCVKLRMNDGCFERLLNEKINWQEGIEFFHFN